MKYQMLATPRLLAMLAALCLGASSASAAALSDVLGLLDSELPAFESIEGVDPVILINGVSAGGGSSSSSASDSTGSEGSLSSPASTYSYSRPCGMPVMPPTCGGGMPIPGYYGGGITIIINIVININIDIDIDIDGGGNPPASACRCICYGF